MKELKSNFVDVLINREQVLSIGNSARLLVSWIDAILEFTVLKHEAIYLTAKRASVQAKIEDIQIKWPRKKNFIESAYKLLLFTKRLLPEIKVSIDMIRMSGSRELLDFTICKNNMIAKKFRKVQSDV